MEDYIMNKSLLKAVLAFGLIVSSTASVTAAARRGAGDIVKEVTILQSIKDADSVANLNSAIAALDFSDTVLGKNLVQEAATLCISERANTLLIAQAKTTSAADVPNMIREAIASIRAAMTDKLTEAQITAVETALTQHSNTAKLSFLAIAAAAVKTAVGNIFDAARTAFNGIGESINAAATAITRFMQRSSLAQEEGEENPFAE